MEQIDASTFQARIKNEDIIIGGESSTFQPQINLKRWGREKNLGILLPTIEHGEPVLDNDRVVWRGDTLGIDVYSDDKLHYDIILNSQPATRELSLELDMTGLVAWHQPELTNFEKSIGEVRPEDVIDSFAFYRTEPSFMYPSRELGRKYRSGKAFHLYRLKAITPRGEEWIQARIEDNKLIIPIKASWRYPVIIDPTFGVEDTGGSTLSMSNNLTGPNGTCPEAGTGTYISMYLGSGSTAHAKGCLYDTSGNKISNGDTEDKNVTPGAYWTDFAFNTGPSLVNQVYVIAGWAGGSIYISYDYAGPETRYYKSETYNGFPASVSWSTIGNRTVSCHCDYDTGGGGWTNIAKVHGVTATDLAKVNGVAVADIAKFNGVAV